MSAADGRALIAIDNEGRPFAALAPARAGAAADVECRRSVFDRARMVVALA